MTSKRTHQQLLNLVEKKLIPDRIGEIWAKRIVLLWKAGAAESLELANQGLLMTYEQLQENLNLEKPIKLSKEQNLGEQTRETIKNYLKSIPGFNVEKEDWKNIGTVLLDVQLEVHGYVQMLLNQVVRNEGVGLRKTVSTINKETMNNIIPKTKKKSLKQTL